MALYQLLRVDVSALPQEQAFISDIVLARAKERCEFKDGGRAINLVFALDPSFEDESYRVTVNGGDAKVTAGRFRALMYGAGRFLRSIEWTRDGMKLVDSDGVYKPEKAIRVAYYARHFFNWYHEASVEELTRYTEDLELWGINAVCCQISFPVVDSANDKNGESARFERISKEFGKVLKKLDLGFYGSGGSNQAPFDTDPALRGEPNVDPKRGNGGFNVCPAKEGGTELLVDQQRKSLADQEGMPIAAFDHWPFDEGGCNCEKCRPWGSNGYLKLCKKLAAINKEKYPDAATVLSTWTFHDDEYEMLWNYLATDDSKWIDVLLIDSHEDFPKYPLTHPLPRKMPIITFPEISMWGREPWGGFGAIAMPARFERLFRQVEKIAEGFRFYSEGLSEDINKVVVTRLYCEPSLHWQDIVREYCRWEFPGVDEEKFIELVTCLENTQVLPNFGKTSLDVTNVGRGDAPAMDDFETRCKYCLAEATKAEQLSAELEKSLADSLRTAWRWRHLRLRTIIDKEIFTARKWNTPVADEAYHELVKIYNARRTYGWVRPPVEDR